MRLLFVKDVLAWPRASGHDVHTYFMMKACADLGHDIGLATVAPPDPAAIAGLPLVASFGLDTEPPGSPREPIRATRLQFRYRSYWGMPDRRLYALRTAVRDMRADAVVISGLGVLPYFPALNGVARVWYAADEWVLHHLSMIRIGSAALTEDLRWAVVKGLYERAHRNVIDRVWVVSDRDRWAMRWIAGFRGVDVLPNGVDSDHYRPSTEPPVPRSAVFWGRLDFGPNIQALAWFCRRVWPQVRERVPDASLTIVGFQPGDDTRALAAAPGISLVANLPDLRDEVRRHAVAVLPFVSGAGIKNKLLEAAAMGMPIVCTPNGALGLRGSPPLAIARSPKAFADALIDLWHDDVRRRDLGAAGRAWVVKHHTWLAVAREAMARLAGTRTGARKSAASPR